MKKVLLFMIAVLTISSASAQFQVQEKQKLPEVVWRSPLGGHVKLYAQEQSNGKFYYLVGINTTNDYDDKLLLHLGNKDKAIATLTQLVNDLYVQGEIYELADDRGEAFTLQCSAMNQYVIYKEGYAGRGYVTVGQFERMLSVFIEE
ncbi:MAG: hypothetical protein II307_05700 [Alistipes sp.]|nr:hypothetical protein [Alistipes sp.]